MSWNVDSVGQGALGNQSNADLTVSHSVLLPPENAAAQAVTLLCLGRDCSGIPCGMVLLSLGFVPECLGGKTLLAFLKIRAFSLVGRHLRMLSMLGKNYISPIKTSLFPKGK